MVIRWSEYIYIYVICWSSGVLQLLCLCLGAELHNSIHQMMASTQWTTSPPLHQLIKTAWSYAVNGIIIVKEREKKKEIGEREKRGGKNKVGKGEGGGGKEGKCLNYYPVYARVDTRQRAGGDLASCWRKDERWGLRWGGESRREGRWWMEGEQGWETEQHERVYTVRGPAPRMMKR